MHKQDADDPEFEALRKRHKVEIEASGMTRNELIDLLARNFASYHLLCQSFENTRHHLERAVEARTQLGSVLELQNAEEKRKLLALVNALPNLVRESFNAGGSVLAAKAGRCGAARKHAPMRELKEWALQEAAKMRGAQMDIAKKLALRIPSHLVDVSDDPKRLFYDTLRQKNKPPKMKQVRGFVPRTRGNQT